MMIDDLKPIDLKRLLDFIGSHPVPSEPAKKLFPDMKKGYVKLTNQIREYCKFKLMAYNTDYSPETRRIFVEECAEIWTKMPEKVRAMNFETFLKKRR